MNIDVVQQDQQIWHNQAKQFLGKLKDKKQHEGVRYTEDMLVPPFEKESDREFNEMVTMLQEIVGRVNLKAEHQV